MHRLQELWQGGLAAPRHVRSSQTRDPGMEPVSLHSSVSALEGRFLTIGLPGKSTLIDF